MDPQSLSRTWTVRALTEADLNALLALCRGNPLYYRHCPPDVTADSLRADLAALPPGAAPEDKYFLGFYGDAGLVAAMDLILNWPRTGTAFIGFFMVAAAAQGRGMGSSIVRQAADALKAQGFDRLRLGYVKTNPQSRGFWLKNSFAPTGTESDAGAYTIVVMERAL